MKMIEKNEIEEIVEGQIKPHAPLITSWNYFFVLTNELKETYELKADWFEKNKGYRASLFEDVLNVLSQVEDTHVCFVSFNFVDDNFGFALLMSNNNLYFTGPLRKPEDG